MLITALLRRIPKHLLVLVAGLILGIGSVPANAAATGNGSPPAEVKQDTAPASLFSPLKAQTQADSAIVRDFEVVRSRQVDIDLNLLTHSADLPASAAGRVISLNLFDDVSFVAEADRVERTSRRRRGRRCR